MRLESDILFSLIIPTRQRPDQIGRCLQSIFTTASDPASVEVVLLCDFDDTGARQLCDFAESRSWNIRIIFQKRSRRMIRDYNNYGTQCSTGHYIWQLNDDIEIATPGWDRILSSRIEDFLTDKPDRILYISIDDSTHTQWGREEDFGCCFPLLTKEAVDVMNCHMPSEIDMWGADVVLWEIFRCLPEPRILIANADVKVLHHSRHNDTATTDQISDHVERVSGKRDLTDAELLAYVTRLSERLGVTDHCPQMPPRRIHAKKNWRYYAGQMLPRPVRNSILTIFGKPTTP